MQNVPDEDHVARLVRWKKLITVGDDVMGVFPQAFERRPGEEYLSVTWIEYYGPLDDNGIPDAMNALRADSSSGKLGKARLAIAKVENIKSSTKLFGSSVRVTHEPTANNPGHAALRRLDDTNIEILNLLAQEVFASLHVCTAP